MLLADLSLSRHLHPLRAVVEGRRQLHGNRRTDVTVPCPEPATPAALRRHQHVHHGFPWHPLRVSTKRSHRKATLVNRNALCVVVVVVVVAVVRTLCLYDVSVHAKQLHAMNSGDRTPGSQDSRRPRHPFSALMAGVNPGRVPCAQGPTNKDHHTRDVVHLVEETLKNLFGPPDRLDREKRPLRHDRDVDVKTPRGSPPAATVGAPLSPHKRQLWNSLDRHNKDIDLRVYGNKRISMVSQAMGSNSAPQQGCTHLC